MEEKEVVIKSKIQQQREGLPIYSFRDDLIEAIKQKKILIVIGETGSGKTTQIAQYLFESGFAEKGIIGVTQPRRVAAVSVARRVSEEINCKLGDKVGYTVRFSDCSSSETKIKYMTDGCLLRECLIDPLLTKYSVIILDEAHERSVHTDILFGLMKVTIEKRPDLKVLITSATLDDGKFSTFFNDCPTFFVPGRSFPVDIFYLEKKSKSTNFIESALDTILQIHEHEAEGDILVFLTGQSEIEDACRRLKKKFSKLLNENPELTQLLVLPLYAALPPQEQVKVFEPTPYRTRKVILATNIAETSLTVDGIVYVVDPGFVKQKMFNPRTGMETLEVVEISQVAAQQRAGRAGRTRPGKCYRLYTKKDFETLEPATIPEIQRTNLVNIVLSLKVLGIDDVIGFQFLDSPDPLLIIQAVKQLYLLGALDSNGKITALGKQMGMFPLDPSFSRILLASIQYNCVEEILTIISMLSIENLFYKPSDKKLSEEVDQIRRQLFLELDKSVSSDLIGDPFFFLFIYNTWKKKKHPSEWCREHYFQPRLLEEADDIRNQLIEIMKKEKLYSFPSHNKKRSHLDENSETLYESIAQALCTGLFMNTAKKLASAPISKFSSKDHFSYLILKLQTIAHIHPISCVPFSSKPTPLWIIYNELLSSSHIFMRIVCAIKYEWVRDSLQKRNNINLNQLLGRDVDYLLHTLQDTHIDSSSTASTDESSSSNQRSTEELDKKFARKNDDESIQAAKNRYLKRKKKK